MKLATQLSLSFLFATCTSWSATVLDFEGIAPYPSGSVFIQNFYNGGAASNGNIGPNFGVTFSAPAQLICLNTPGIACSNTSRGGLGDPSSALGALYFLTNSAITMNVNGGFTTGFSFDYVAISKPGSVSVFDAPNGGGTLLQTFALPLTASACSSTFSAGFCPFAPAGVAFAGTAQSVVFAGVGDQIVFDDITFGSSTPGTGTPEPATAGLAGLTLGALIAARRLRLRGN